MSVVLNGGTETLEIFGMSQDSFTKEICNDDLNDWFMKIEEEDLSNEIDDYLFELFEDELEDSGLEADTVSIYLADSGKELYSWPGDSCEISTVEKTSQETENDVHSKCFLLEVSQIWRGTYGTCDIPTNESGFDPSQISILIDQSENRFLGVIYDNKDVEIDYSSRDMRGKGSEINLYQYDENGEESLLDLDLMYSEYLASKLPPNKLYETYLKKVEEFGLDLDTVPTKYVDRKLCITAVQQNGSALEYVPEDLRDKALCLTAVQQNGSTLLYVPVVLQDKALCLIAVQYSGSTLEYVPEDLRDKDLCLTAIQQDGSALEYVPEDLRDKDLCLTAIQQDGSALEYVLENLRNKDLCLAAVQQNGSALEYVPEDLRDKDLCFVAIKNDSPGGTSLRDVPDDLIDRELCLAAVTCRDTAMNFVPDKYKDKEVCLAYINHWGGNIQFIPSAMKDLEMYTAACSKTGDAIKYVPKKFKGEVLSALEKREK